jgi:hypothetical protein
MEVFKELKNDFVEFCSTTTIQGMRNIADSRQGEASFILQSGHPRVVNKLSRKHYLPFFKSGFGSERPCLEARLSIKRLINYYYFISKQYKSYKNLKKKLSHRGMGRRGLKMAKKFHVLFKWTPNMNSKKL